MTQFCRFDLRTTDADAARAFYTQIFGHDRAVIWPLHEQALARGARPHWLGHLGVENVELARATFLERGATPLGPTQARADVGQIAVLRDPGGAILALSTAPSSAPAQPNVNVVWHVLNTTDAARACANYHELFGWALGDPVELAEQGTFRRFAWGSGGVSVGAIGDIAGRAGVHPQWLFVFEVPAFAAALAATRAAGGVVLEPTTVPDGGRIYVCDDPQGAAFALREPAR